jgi:hypothetical protein
MGDEVTYELATARWRRTDTVQVISFLDSEIADFPLSFLASCGDNSWQYILDVVHQLIDPIANHPGGFFVVNEDGEEDGELPVDLGEPPCAGIFRFKQLGMSIVTGRFRSTMVWQA